jgi:hypothetical protein
MEGEQIMAETPFRILQSIRNRLDTAESGWLAYAEACTQAYDAAYTAHTSALGLAKLNLTAQAEQAWKVLNIMLAISGASWVPRLLKPVTTIAGEAFGFDELTAAWMADAIKSGGDEFKKEMKEIAVTKLKNCLGSTQDSFEPVVDTTLNYASRLKEGIYNRAEALKHKMDEIIENDDSMTTTAAEALRKGFYTGCPFITDEPKDRGDTFKKTFQNESELSMWVQWAIARDEAYWIRAEAGGIWDPYANDERHAFDPIRDRLVVLGVPASVTKGTFAGQSGHPSTWLPPLDMVEFIHWAKNRSRSLAAQQVCKPVTPALLQLRQQENACRMGK